MQRRAFNTCSLSFSFFSSPIVRVACRCARPSGTHGSERHAKQNETWRRRPTLNTQAATQPMVRLDIGDGRRFLAFFFLTNRYRRPTRGRPSGRKRRKRTKDNAEVGHSGHESAIRRHRRHVPLSTRKPTFPRFPLPRSPLSSRLWAHIHGRDSLQDTPPPKKKMKPYHQIRVLFADRHAKMGLFLSTWQRVCSRRLATRPSVARWRLRAFCEAQNGPRPFLYCATTVLGL